MVNYSFELNNAMRDSDINFDRKSVLTPNSKVVEIFSALTDGKDTSKYGKDTDKTVSLIKNLGEGIANGDSKALAELNTIRKLSVEPLLQTEINMLNVYGDVKQLGFDESIEVESFEYIGDKSREQALNADVVFPAVKKDKYTVGTKTISGGWATDYRRLQLGDMSSENEGKSQIRIDIVNKMKRAIIENAYNSVVNATGVHYNFEGAGLTKVGVDEVIRAIRRFGNGTSVVGDYALLQQFTPWAGYNAEHIYDDARYSYTHGISSEDLRDIRANGILGSYAGSTLVEMPNPYDLTTINSSGDNFETVLDQGIAIVLPKGGTNGSPIKSWTRGGLTSFSGNDVSTGQVLTRFDIEFATDVTKGREFMIGFLKDTNLSR